MTIHYHGTPITPAIILQSLAGRSFCVSYYRPDNLEVCKRIGEQLMLDNGAFSAWRNGFEIQWPDYYAWVEQHINPRLDWAVVPDVIDGTEQQNDELLLQWPHGFDFGAPVWHLHESYHRLHTLAHGSWSRICFGSSGQYATVGSDSWRRRVDDAFNVICTGTGHLPCKVHMLRGMSLSGTEYPFTSVDSTDIARNARTTDEAQAKAARWGALNCASTWCRRGAVPIAYKGAVNVYDSRFIDRQEVLL